MENIVTLHLKNPVDVMTKPGMFHKITKIQLGRWYPIGTNGSGNCAVAVPLLGGDIFIWLEVDKPEDEINRMMTDAFGKKPSGSEMGNMFSM